MNTTTKQTYTLTKEIRQVLDKRRAWALKNPAQGRNIEQIAVSLGVKL